MLFTAGMVVVPTSGEVPGGVMAEVMVAGVMVAGVMVAGVVAGGVVPGGAQAGWAQITTPITLTMMSRLL